MDFEQNTGKHTFRPVSDKDAKKHFTRCYPYLTENLIKTPCDTVTLHVTCKYSSKICVLIKRLHSALPQNTSERTKITHALMPLNRTAKIAIALYLLR